MEPVSSLVTDIGGSLVDHVCHTVFLNMTVHWEMQVLVLLSHSPLSSPGSAVWAGSCKTSVALVGDVEPSALITNHRLVLLLMGCRGAVGAVWGTRILFLCYPWSGKPANRCQAFELALRMWLGGQGPMLRHQTKLHIPCLYNWD